MMMEYDGDVQGAIEEPVAKTVAYATFLVMTSEATSSMDELSSTIKQSVLC